MRARPLGSWGCATGSRNASAVQASAPVEVGRSQAHAHQAETAGFWHSRRIKHLAEGDEVTRRVADGLVNVKSKISVQRQGGNCCEAWQSDCIGFSARNRVVACGYDSGVCGGGGWDIGRTDIVRRLTAILGPPTSRKNSGVVRGGSYNSRWGGAAVLISIQTYVKAVLGSVYVSRCYGSRDIEKCEAEGYGLSLWHKKRVIVLLIGQRI